MKIGQEGDTRKFRALRKSDYYEAKAAVEAGEVKRWTKCAVCGQNITGQMYYLEEGKYACFRCHNE